MKTKNFPGKRDPMALLLGSFAVCQSPVCDGSNAVSRRLDCRGPFGLPAANDSFRWL